MSPAGRTAASPRRRRSSGLNVQMVSTRNRTPAERAEAAAADAAAAEEAAKWDLQLGSPSKINLFLRILARRDDGFHDLASLFQAVSLHDDMWFAVLPEDATEDVLECDEMGVPTDKTNLVVKALDTFRARTGKTTFFRVRLDKRVPAQAGLGGGSANAATALWAANQLCGKPASVEELADFGAAFGSDVSFFFTMGTAYCTGRGEILRPLPRLPPQTLWLVKPSEGLSTGAVFTALDMEQTSDADPAQLLKTMQTEMLYMCNDFVNDLETPSFKLSPRLGKIKKALQESGFCQVLMSGSGTSFFCLGEPDDELYGNTFAEVFGMKYDVKVMRAMFIWRTHPDYWFFQQPSEAEIIEYIEKRDAHGSPVAEKEWVWE
jgi:4-diphosphocytidyl-2-C-methyl-D-erythritol kinase